MRYITNQLQTAPTVAKWVTDTPTGLDWAVYDQKYLNWEEATEYAKSLGNGWRLPTVQELIGIVNYEKANTATDVPKITSTSYWSATTYTPNDFYAWIVYFTYGYLNYDRKTYSYQVVCVRNSNHRPSGTGKIK